MPLARIVSGGQTGVDRAALDVAIARRLPHGGWCPRGRRAEDGAVPARYALREHASPDYAARTERNVVDSDATLVLAIGSPTNGTALTVRLAARRRTSREHASWDTRSRSRVPRTGARGGRARRLTSTRSTSATSIRRRISSVARVGSSC